MDRSNKLWKDDDSTIPSSTDSTPDTSYDVKKYSSTYDIKKNYTNLP